MKRYVSIDTKCRRCGIEKNGEVLVLWRHPPKVPYYELRIRIKEINHWGKDTKKIKKKRFWLRQTRSKA